MTNFLDYGIDKVDYTSSLPKPIIKEHDGIKVVRDDLLDGGTKRRAFTIYVKSKPEIDEFVYASPRQGYAQLSLAYACRDLGKKCTVTVPQGERYWLTNKAVEVGANIIEVPMGYLTNIQAKAKKYCFDNGAHLIPFGGDHPIIIEAMRQTALSLDVNPNEVWTVMSSVQQECKEDERPPFQSSLTYDSKAWTFIQKHATKGALFWNVGK